MRIHRADIASMMVLGGMAAQGYGVYFFHGPAWSMIIVGTEIALMGLVGVLRNAR